MSGSSADCARRRVADELSASGNDSESERPGAGARTSDPRHTPKQCGCRDLQAPNLDLAPSQPCRSKVILLSCAVWPCSGGAVETIPDNTYEMSSITFERYIERCCLDHWFPLALCEHIPAWSRHDSLCACRSLSFYSPLQAQWHKWHFRLPRLPMMGRT